MQYKTTLETRLENTLRKEMETRFEQLETRLEAKLEKTSKLGVLKRTEALFVLIHLSLNVSIHLVDVSSQGESKSEPGSLPNVLRIAHELIVILVDILHVIWMFVRQRHTTIWIHVQHFVLCLFGHLRSSHSVTALMPLICEDEHRLFSAVAWVYLLVYIGTELKIAFRDAKPNAFISARWACLFRFLHAGVFFLTVKATKEEPALYVHYFLILQVIVSFSRLYNGHKRTRWLAISNDLLTVGYHALSIDFGKANYGAKFRVIVLLVRDCAKVVLVFCTSLVSLGPISLPK